MLDMSTWAMLFSRFSMYYSMDSYNNIQTMCSMSSEHQREVYTHLWNPKQAA